MNIFSGIWKKKRTKQLQECNFLLEELNNPENPRILYLGNGAEGTSYEKLFKEHHILGKQLSYGKDSTIFMAYQEIDIRQDSQIVRNGFFSSKADFMGFWARKKVNGSWLWFMEDGTWQTLSEKESEKHFFKDTEEVKDLFGDGTKLIVMQAQWRDKRTKEILRNGYPMFSNELMAHAFGGMNGHTYGNTLADYNNGVVNGYKYFEVDLSYTWDKRLVLCHGWSKSNCKHTGFEYSPLFKYMTYRKVMKMKVHGNEIMDARQFYRLMKERPEDTFEIDFHNISGEDVKQRIRSLVEDFEYDTKALDRLLIQAYSKQMYLDMDEVYHFKHYQYLVGKEIHNLDSIIDFCLDHDICVVALRANLATLEAIRKIKNAGLYVMCYTINKDADFAKYLLENGVDTICTDYITAEQLNEAKNTFGNHPFYLTYAENGKQAGTETVFYQNDGTECLKKNSYTKQNKEFCGWNLRVEIDGKKLWYCMDGLYHTHADIKPGTKVEKYLFTDEAVLPELTVKENMTATMVAVWKSAKQEDT